MSAWMALGSLCTVLTIVGPPVLNADTSMSFIFQVACAQLCNKRSGGFSLIYFSCHVTLLTSDSYLPEALVFKS
jgi:hypothetical protein